MSADKIVVHLNDKRLARTFETFYDDVFEAGAASVRAELEATRAELAEWKESANSNKITGELWPSPATPVLLKARLEHLASWISGLSKRIDTDKAELEATRAELAAERAKPKGGVAWALRNKNTGTLDGSALNDGHPKLHESKEAAEKWSEGHEFRWESVPYPIGDGADELKAALEAEEKAEAEAAAWKEAANFGAPLSIESPTDLAKRLAELDEWLENAKQTIAALKAAPAEVPPLDRWRVMATASKVAEQMYLDAETLSIEEVAYEVARELIAAMLRDHSDGDAKPYPIKN